MYGKVPPNARDLEEAVLGAILLDASVFDTVCEILRAECFYVEANQNIFSSMLSLRQKQMPIDYLTLIEELKAKEVLDAIGGPIAIVKITNRVPSSAHVEAHSRIILQKFIQRELIRVSGEIIGDAYEDSADVKDLISESERKVLNVAGFFQKKSYSDSASVIARTLNIIDAQRNSTDDFTGVPTGFPSLDRITYGWQPTDLIILAARPSVGKTALALNLAINAARHHSKPTPVGLFSLEMSETQCMNRILSAESGIMFEKISRGKMSDFEYDHFIKEGVRKVEIAPLYIDDTPGLNIFEFRSKARNMVTKQKVGLIIIDYLQLMTGDAGKGNREQEISNISRNLKIVAKELNVPIIALSQLSRQVESRKENKMPQLSDLRESGAIEQDADCVMFIYRPEYHDILTNENGESTAGETHIKTAKNRNGKLGITRLRARFEIQKFEEVPDEPNLPKWTPVPTNVKSFSGSADKEEDTPF